MAMTPYLAEITHKGRIVATLEGYDRDQLEACAHHYAASEGYHRAIVQIKPKPPEVRHHER